tara:strand:+ start:975 stop:2510 length:1536 start_codon:yes stop_codon:yes gene_type:complete
MSQLNKLKTLNDRGGTVDTKDTGLVLTDEQQVAIDAIINFLDTPNDVGDESSDIDQPKKYDNIFTLSGIAGAGKSTIIKAALKGRSGVVGAAISHSAKEVLEDAMDIDCFTIASLLGLQQKIDDEGGITFVPRPTGRAGYRLPIEYSDVIIIDECSMIDDDIFNIINNKIKPEAKVIYLGDKSQLAPVKGDKDSITFNYTQANLSNAVRYAGPIADLGIRIRDEIAKCEEDAESGGSPHLINDWMEELGHDERVSNVNEDGSGYIFINSAQAILNISGKLFNDDDPDSLRLIAYKNFSIAKINKAVRQRLYNTDGELKSIPQFMPGELLISNGGYAETVLDESNPDKPRSKKVPVISNGTSLIIKKVTGTDHKKVPSFAIEFNGMQKNKAPIHCVADGDGMDSYNAVSAMLKANAQEDKFQWKYVYDFKDQFAWFSYGYAISSHKSQGRTYNNVIIFEDDIFNVKKASIKNKLQSLYVACTRAKTRVFIFNKNKRIDNSGVPQDLRDEYGF